MRAPPSLERRTVCQESHEECNGSCSPPTRELQVQQQRRGLWAAVVPSAQQAGQVDSGVMAGDDLHRGVDAPDVSQGSVPLLNGGYIDLRGTPALSVPTSSTYFRSADVHHAPACNATSQASIVWTCSRTRLPNVPYLPTCRSDICDACIHLHGALVLVCEGM